MKDIKKQIKEILKIVKGNPNHSKEFLTIIKEAKDTKQIANAIRAITHSKPLLVFWISPKGEVLDAKKAHRQNPPNGDKSVLSDPQHGGYLRGRVAYIGDTIYIVVYGRSDKGIISKGQQSLLRRTYPKLFKMVKAKNPKLTSDDFDSAIFIDEYGKEIIV